jgi:MoaA/NifB/PqqE/SkfB family radical SAM enzyme
LSVNQSDKSRDTWCPIPWVGPGVRSVGNLRYCCHANGSASKGLLKKSDGEPINLEFDDVSQGLNAELVRDVRVQMLKGERHPGCARCYIEEDAGIFSRRQSEKVTWEKDINLSKLLSNTTADGSIEEKTFPILYLDLRFGNRCNLKCRMCSPTESDRWYEVHTKLWENDVFKEGGRQLQITQDPKGRYSLKEDPYKWYESELFWKNLDQHMPQLKRIYLAGGEPFLIEGQFDLLKRCVDNGYAKDITLEYNSNITLLSDKMLKLWENFYKVEVGVSIDGIGPINDYIRYPSKWEQVSHNLTLLDTAKGNFKLWWAATIQAYNLYHLPEMMMWIVRQKYKRVNTTLPTKEILTSHQLSNPKFLSIRVFPEKSKDHIESYFQKFKLSAREEIYSLAIYTDEEKERLCARFSSVLDHYVTLMRKENLEHLKSVFWHYTNRLDTIHGTSFKETCPEAYELML